MDPAVPERKYDWGMMTSSSGVRLLDVASQTVAIDPLGLNTIETPVLVGG